MRDGAAAAPGGGRPGGGPGRPAAELQDALPAGPRRLRLGAVDTDLRRAMERAEADAAAKRVPVGGLPRARWWRRPPRSCTPDGADAANRRAAAEQARTAYTGPSSAGPTRRPSWPSPAASSTGSSRTSDRSVRRARDAEHSRELVSTPRPRTWLPGRCERDRAHRARQAAERPTAPPPSWPRVRPARRRSGETGPRWCVPRRRRRRRRRAESSTSPGCVTPRPTAGRPSGRCRPGSTVASFARTRGSSPHLAIAPASADRPRRHTGPGRE
ncbi:hypothetical protein HBB16_16610 [Pseudonocardia sp. MCCB 268]|nr:hypothetical protein [Pseudonocardia cytotoxica]